jgi:chromate transporter
MLTSSPPNLSQLALLFLKIGIIGFGGPAAHIALMEEEVVKRRGWMTKERFLDLVGATNLIPGPNSTEMAIHIGYIFGGVNYGFSSLDLYYLRDFTRCGSDFCGD